ncbi:MAG TPA: hypothetical protein VG755_12460 [Nannocystaceae bacterium]|nr:hypothetical protein [Nannocystaceae bacterium]
MKNATLTLLVGAAMTACVPPTDHDDDTNASTASEESSESESTGEPQPLCPTETFGPTLHADDIVGHEVWRAEDGPHIVMYTVDVREDAILEIEPCAVVQLTEDTGINVAFPGTPTTGTLLAEGTAEQPIRFEGLHGNRWGQILVHTPGTATLRHVTISGGGGFDTSGASLIAIGDGTFPTQRNLLVDHVTVEDSLGYGVNVTRHAAFADSSTELVITGSGDELHPFPMMVDEHAIDSLPQGDYTGNVVDEILVEPHDRLEEDTTMKNLGVPYRIGSSPVDRFAVGKGDGDVATTLTIEPGTTLRFHPETAFEIDHYSGDRPARGNLVAVGTPDAPIVFTSAADVPAPGDWVGLWFGGIVNPETRLQHTQIEYTGFDCGCILLTCNELEQFEGAVILSMPPSSMFITDSVIRHGAGHGIVQGYDGENLDFAASNSFEDLNGCEATLPRMPECPDPRPTCE